ncbi:multicopper oxidase family protein [Micromonospora sp. KC723]|uniref:multicopper oxidase family protein n=1 Tax=Micromonospora sp. KC723 TaxID=2530381 RepID=UPI0010520346|nr:multicopper oxidase domain-containing protein [Micromonospora sp. KC723]TDB78131.1 multicopper oxidase family protein [Micromonospora sp. KC723]
MQRRDLIRYGMAAGAALLPMGFAANLWTRSAQAEQVAPFSTRLRVPRVLSPYFSTSTEDYYKMDLVESTASILPGLKTPVLTFNGQFPGPTIRARRGRATRVKITNRLTTPTSIHLHGADVPAESDGHPTDEIVPGASKTYRYGNIQPAATLWYHDHVHHLESEHVYRGLSGLYLIDDDETDALGLPSGAYDLPLQIRDAHLGPAGELVYTWNDFASRTSVLVNGGFQPTHEVRGTQYRIRLANVSNTRPLRLRLSDASEMVQIASDGGLLSRPVPCTEVELWPAERAEVVVDFSRYAAGTKLMLENVFAGPSRPDRQILQFEVTGPAAATWTPPALLRSHPDLGTPIVTRNIDFVWSEANGGFYSIDGQGYDPHRVQFQVRRGTTELWHVNNSDAVRNFPHSMHVHLVQFRVLDRNGVPVGEGEAYPKDTVRIPAGQNVRMLVKFDTPYTGIYPFHCHFLDHAAHSMMAQLEVVP